MLREEKLKFIQENVYGVLPEKPQKVTATILEEKTVFAGKAKLESLILTAEYNGQEVKFPFNYCYRIGEENQKTFIMLNFRDNIPDFCLPAEEVIDRGWAFAVAYYENVTSDDLVPDENSKILGFRKEKNSPSKIMIWAWCEMRILDYLYTRKELDKNNVAVLGHSRLGKTALVAGALDERFKLVHSNDSGTAGAGLYSMWKEGVESFDNITKVFPHWFCENFFRYTKDSLDFDQDMLLSLIAPRYLSVASAEQDLWANPEAEFTATKLAGKEWEKYGLKGLVAPDKAEVGICYHDGCVAYHMRKGTHYFSREDYNNVFDFYDKKIKGEL